MNNVGFRVLGLGILAQTFFPGALQIIALCGGVPCGTRFPPSKP